MLNLVSELFLPLLISELSRLYCLSLSKPFLFLLQELGDFVLQCFFLPTMASLHILELMSVIDSLLLQLLGYLCAVFPEKPFDGFELVLVKVMLGKV